MHQAHTSLQVQTRGRAFVDITRETEEWVRGCNIVDGLLTVFIRHTSASLLIQENADPEVLRDLQRFFARLVPDGDTLFKHRAEGDDDMPAHVRAALTQTHLSIPVVGAKPALGTWQGIYLVEHRVRAHRREVMLHLIGQ
ncbi:MAG TPA: secondary thiamine-phosphate synthase enzyme YjbQ [Burkholderiaceae bacterium]|nr:secondary thiamine-phosphate synthase enzyme YjbQ [Burkholderiaceae bacterium]